MNTLCASVLVALSLSSLASAKEFIVSTPVSAENENGNRLATKFGTNPDEPTVYEIIPANDEVADALTTKGCTAMALEGSVLHRQTEIDHERRRHVGESVKLLVRKVKDCRMVILPR